MFVQQFFVEGLGCASYLVACEVQGLAAVIDPDRETGKYLAEAEARGWKITHVIETHLHADHVSGNTALARQTGAEIYIHEQAQVAFPARTVKDGDTLQIGTVRLAVRHTPGHTRESITLLAIDTTRSEEPWLALTGDTLFVGDIGRPDLVGAQAARELAGQMHHTLSQKIFQLDDSLLVYPGHGAGSLCGKNMGEMRSTTLGYERKHNPALAPRSRENFVDFATRDLPEQPGNHQRIKEINQRGPVPLGEVIPRPLSVEESIPFFQRGAGLLDTRSRAAYVVKHVPGSVHLEADEQLSNRIGFILPPGIPVVLMLEDEKQYIPVVYSLARVGYEQVAGYLFEGIEAWEAAGLPTASGDIGDITPAELHDQLTGSEEERPVVVDVRETWEYSQGHVPGAVLIPLGELARRLDELDPARPVAVICASGHRSQSGAILLGQKNFRKIYNVLGGTTGWMRQGLPLER